MRLGYLLLAVALDTLCFGCTNCNDVDCDDSVSVLVHTEDGMWPDGSYRFDIAYDDRSDTCTMTLPDDQAASGEVLPLECMSELVAFLAPEFECTQTTSNASVTQRCSPIPEQFVVELSLLGAPDSIELTVSRDAEQLASTDADVSYRNVRPGGAGCPVKCREGDADITL